MLDASPAPSCFESAQFARPHGIDESLVKIRTGAFDNLKADHA
jgi:hypothetical protein